MIVKLIGWISSVSSSPPPLPPGRMNNIYHQKGRESNWNSTSSQVDIILLGESTSMALTTQPASTMFYSPIKFRHGPSRPESVRPELLLDKDITNSATMLSPGVTDSSSSLSSLGLSLAKYMANTARRGQCHYETSHVALVKSVFTEAGYYRLMMLMDRLSIRSEQGSMVDATKSEYVIHIQIYPLTLT